MRANNDPSGFAPAFLRLVLVITAAGSFSACQHAQDSLASIPYLGVNAVIQPTGPLPAPSERKWPDAALDVLGQQASGFGLAQMPELQSYLNGLLARIKTAAGVPDWPGSVYLRASSNLEAYSTAGGNIYISPSWVTSAESEDELVALLSHEFGHIYLHYHQIAEVVEGTEQTAKLAALGLALAKGKTLGNAWTPVDSLLFGYGAGRDLAVGDYGRTEEMAADNFGLNVSLKLGYSYANGIKAFLERMATWEEENARRRQLQREQLRAAFVQLSREKAAKGSTTGKPVNPAIEAPVSDLNAGIAALFYDLKGGVQEGVETVTAKHPDINARIERQAAASEKLSDAMLGKDPVVAPLVQARKRPSTAAALRNYQLASEAIRDIGSPTALDKARKAASAPTANQALPLLAFYKAQLAAESSPGRRSKVMGDPGKVLELNFNSPADRAWVTYFERAQQFQAAGNIASAKKAIDAGFAVFRKAPDAWPPVIRFYGQTQGWKIAKAMADDCVKEHRSMEAACRAAAASPEEQAEADRKSQEKSERIINKVLKKDN